MGKTYTTLGNKQNTKVLNYELIKGKNVFWKLKQFKQRFTKG